MLVKSHGSGLSLKHSLRRRGALRARRGPTERNRRREHGKTNPKVLPGDGPAFRSAPGRSERCRLYTRFRAARK
jgi:hypothetical protein